MRLHTRVVPASTGFWLWKRPVYLMDVVLELDQDEISALARRPQQGAMTMGTATTGSVRTPTEVAYSLAALVSGVQAITFGSLERQLEFEESLRRACGTVRTRLMQLQGIGEVHSHDA